MISPIQLVIHSPIQSSIHLVISPICIFSDIANSFRDITKWNGDIAIKIEDIP